MAGTDFFDKDLMNRESSRGRRKDDGAPAMAESEEVDLQRPVSDLNLTQMARHRQDLENQVAESAHELDRLRMRQEEVERERRELEDLRKKQVDYERGRRELSDRLHQSLIMMEKEQLRSERMTELLAHTLAEFKDMLGQIEGMDDENWPEDQLRDELTKALLIMDECRMEYNKGVTKIEAALAGSRASGEQASALMERSGTVPDASRPGFAYWLKAGLAASLPLILTLLTLALAFLYAQSRDLL
jgi:hypothetical protein